MILLYYAWIQKDRLLNKRDWSLWERTFHCVRNSWKILFFILSILTFLEILTLNYLLKLLNSRLEVFILLSQSVLTLTWKFFWFDLKIIFEWVQTRHRTFVSFFILKRMLEWWAWTSGRGDVLSSSLNSPLLLIIWNGFYACLRRLSFLLLIFTQTLLWNSSICKVWVCIHQERRPLNFGNTRLLRRRFLYLFFNEVIGGKNVKLWRSIDTLLFWWLLNSLNLSPWRG